MKILHIASKDYQKTPGLKQEAYCVIQFLWVGNLRQLNGVVLLQSFFDDEKNVYIITRRLGWR